MSAETTHRVHVVLLEAEDRARELERLLGPSASTVIPPVRGVAFFADSRAQAALDAWWGAAVPRDAEPVYVLVHTPGLAGWLRGIDGNFVVGGAASAASEYDAESTIHVRGSEPADLAGALTRIDASIRAQYPAGVHPGHHILDDRREPAAHPDPFELLAAMESPRPALATLREPGPSRTIETGARQRPALRFPGWVRREGARRTSPGPEESDLASQLTRRGATIVAVGSRKGGVGKTSHAAGMAIVAGTVLDAVGHRAAIVDANVANPDAWGHLNLPGGAATVRDVVAALIINGDPPRPVFASTPALACYPESRDASEYSRTDIVRFAQHLRELYTFIVVDMSNRLPDPIAGPEAAAAAYWLEQADCVVLPAASSKQDFNGVLDYLELRDLPPAVVAYITPTTRRNREHPLTKRYLAAIAQRAQCIVNLPDDPERVRFAGMEGIPVQDVSPALGLAYRQLVHAVARTPTRRGS